MATTTKKKPAAKKKPVAMKKPAAMKKPTRPTATTRRTAAKPAAAPMFEKVAFTMFAVDDPHRARAFYEGVLGFTRGLASPDGAWTEYDLPGGGCLALFKHPHAASAKPPGGGASIAFEVADLDALNVRLQAAGVRYTSDVVHGPHCRMSNILDSEGNGIILHELAHKRGQRR